MHENCDALASCAVGKLLIDVPTHAWLMHN
jgi:hypothetical protein